MGCPQPRTDILQDDELLNEAVTDLQETSGELDNDAWNEVARRVGGRRRGKECRERWENKLRPGLKEGAWTKAEFEQVKRMVEVRSLPCKELVRTQPQLQLKAERVQLRAPRRTS
jgi:hypothetical protein